ncbi:hypothetical protein OGATHE_001686 [Ogataea polymorpha]|uniref:Uncharacterized protein n=1 Tax=Ogataea polymorpha TaxID=460523 RepID=A0A9P8TDX2_9ASCO|nr:hypothetical protein OGATHE_001686 [Ogataea polymorpha]
MLPLLILKGIPGKEDKSAQYEAKTHYTPDVILLGADTFLTPTLPITFSLELDNLEPFPLTFPSLDPKEALCLGTVKIPDSLEAECVGDDDIVVVVVVVVDTRRKLVRGFFVRIGVRLVLFCGRAVLTRLARAFHGNSLLSDLESSRDLSSADRRHDMAAQLCVNHKGLSFLDNRVWHQRMQSSNGLIWLVIEHHGVAPISKLVLVLTTSWTLLLTKYSRTLRKGSLRGAPGRDCLGDANAMKSLEITLKSPWSTLSYCSYSSRLKEVMSSMPRSLARQTPYTTSWMASSKSALEYPASLKPQNGGSCWAIGWSTWCGDQFWTSTM